MKSSLREEIIEHNAKELFDIVLDIESYPYFIPWCSAMKVHSKSDKEIYADMIVWYKYFMPQKFGSHVEFDKKNLKGTILTIIYPEDTPLKIDDLLIVEFYSRK